MNPTLLVLAAGMGSRYGGLKQIESFGPSGETLIDYAVHDAVNAGFEKVVFVVRESFLKDFKNLYFGKFEHKIAVDYVLQELDKLPKGFEVPRHREKPWGTGHAVLVAAEKIEQPFAVINADDFYGSQSYVLMASALSSMNDELVSACMVGYALENTISEHGSVNRGICNVDGSGNLVGIKETLKIDKRKNVIGFDLDGKRTTLSRDQIVSMNLIGFTSSTFKLLQAEFSKFIHNNGLECKSEFYIPTILDLIARSSSVPVLKSPEKWLGVTYPKDKAFLRKKLQELVDIGKYRSPLW